MANVLSRAAAPGTGAPEGDGGGPLQRVLVPLGSFEPMSGALELAVRMGETGAVLRLVHVRMWDPDPPMSNAPRRFYPETEQEAETLLDEALLSTWRHDVEASGVVVDAERSHIADAILDEGSSWGADVIVVARRSPGLFSLAPWERAVRRVLRRATCPVLVVRLS